jgi:hypothetical protein
MAIWSLSRRLGGLKERFESALWIISGQLVRGCVGSWGGLGDVSLVCASY